MEEAGDLTRVIYGQVENQGPELLVHCYSDYTPLET